MSQVLKLSVTAKDAAEADRYAGELRQAILDAAPPGTNISRARSDPEAMQFGETLLVDLAAAVIVHGVIEGVRHFQNLRKAPVQISAGGKPITVDSVTPGLADTILKNLDSPSK